MGEPDQWSAPFEKYGAWWNAGDREKRANGTLSFSPAAGLRLTTTESVVLVPPFGDKPATLNGLVEGVYWTLGDCVCTSTGSTGQSFLVDYAISGVGMDADEVEQLDELRIGFDGGWSTVALRPRGPNDIRSDAISITADLAEGGSVELVSELESLDVSRDGAFGFHDHLRFVGRAKSPMNFRDLHQTLFVPLRDLVILALQRDVALTHCRVAGPGTTVSVGAREHRVSAIVYWNQVTTPDLAEGGARKHPAIRFPSEPADFQRFVASWFSLHDQLKTPISIRVAEITGGASFAEPLFLLAAHSLEALHRRLHPGETDAAAIAARGAALAAVVDEHRHVLALRLSHAHEPTFRKRIKQLVAEVEVPAANVVGAQLRKAVALIVESRNAVTHWEPTNEEPDGLLLFALRMVADAVFDLVLFKRVGLNDDELNGTVRAHQERDVEYWLGRALQAETNAQPGK